MNNPSTARWGLEISKSDFEKLKAGFEPQDMDYKWQFDAVEQAQADRLAVNIVRHWAACLWYVLHLKRETGADGSVRIIIEAITWEKAELRTPEERAKKEAIKISRSYLGCEFEGVPDFSMLEIYAQHPHPGPMALM